MLILIFVLLLSSIGSTTVSRQKESLETALNRDIIHCYAVEGFYPPSLSYMEEHYGLTYDKSLFLLIINRSAPISDRMSPL